MLLWSGVWGWGNTTCTKKLHNNIVKQTTYLSLRTWIQFSKKSNKNICSSRTQQFSRSRIRKMEKSKGLIFSREIVMWCNVNSSRRGKYSTYYLIMSCRMERGKNVISYAWHGYAWQKLYSKNKQGYLTCIATAGLVLGKQMKGLRIGWMDRRISQLRSVKNAAADNFVQKSFNFIFRHSFIQQGWF